MQRELRYKLTDEQIELIVEMVELPSYETRESALKYVELLKSLGYTKAQILEPDEKNGFFGVIGDPAHWV